MLKGSERDFDIAHWKLLSTGLPEGGAQVGFPNEEAAEDRLSQLVWPYGPYCPKCETEKRWYIEARNVFQCSDCGWQYSLRSVSRLRRTRVPLHKFLWAAEAIIATCARKDLLPQQTIHHFSRILGCSYQTARNHRLSMFNELKTVRGGFWGRFVCVREMDESNYDEERMKELLAQYDAWFDD